jgi:hypothetical protein
MSTGESLALLGVPGVPKNRVRRKRRQGNGNAFRAVR